MTTPPDGDDRRAMLLLCADACERPRGSDLARPLTTAQWNALVRSIVASDLERPSALLHATPADLVAAGLAQELADRIAALIERAGDVDEAIDLLAERGIGLLTRLDDGYPDLLRGRLGKDRPVVLFTAGPVHRLDDAGVAVVGSRDVDPAGADFAHALGRALAGAGVPVVSGGARGVDQTAMHAAVEAGGSAIGVMADSLGRAVARSYAAQIEDGTVTLISAVSPHAPFNVGAAMARNRLIYALSRAAVVVASARESGGTWAGAVENLCHGWVPLHVRAADDAPAGNEALISRGGIPLVDPRAVGELVEPAAVEAKLF